MPVHDPADSPYEPGDTVRIHLAEDDFDAQYDGLLCEVVSTSTDDLGELTNCSLDDYQYELRTVRSDDILPVQFRHHDLVPVSTASDD